MQSGQSRQLINGFQFLQAFFLHASKRLSRPIPRVATACCAVRRGFEVFALEGRDFLCHRQHVHHGHDPHVSWAMNHSVRPLSGPNIFGQLKNPCR